MKIVGLIPARYGAVRFPGKPLSLLSGKPMIQHVYEAARAARRLDEVAVATDDERIVQAVRAIGGSAVMTSTQAPSGTDRLAEAARSLPADVYVNIQGDEPLMSPENVDRAVETLLADANREIASLAYPLESERAGDPNIVKVVTTAAGRALYFSRAPIPHYRQGTPGHRKHLGIYVYRADVLREIAALPPSPLERAESLEQLRWLEAGYGIWIGEAAHDSVGVDTPEDRDEVERRMKKEVAS
ncbi:MAG: 3-deoxy-manno-octulosonate cytidylyltransferase [Thermoanaerobaculia bacterium]